LKHSGKTFTRARFLTGAAWSIGAAWTSTLAGWFLGCASVQGGDPDHGGYADAFIHEMMDQLNAWITWLGTNKGYIGEVETPSNLGARRQKLTYNGAPDEQAYATLGQTYLTRADRAGLWYTMQETSERYYKLDAGGYYASIYLAPGDDVHKVINRPGYQAALLERHASARPAGTVGVNFSGGQYFDTNSMSNSNPGSYAVDYWYPSDGSYSNDPVTGKNSFAYLASRGIKLVRIGCRWERIQPTLGAPLSSTELTRLKRSISRAKTAGLSVVLDVHNYGAYYMSDGRAPLGSSGCTAAHFVDLWKRLSDNFASNASVVAYDIMNEPYIGAGISADGYASPAKAWEAYTQQVVDGIRSYKDPKLIMIPTYAGLERTPATHAMPWIKNGGDIMYTSHHYFDHLDSSSGNGGGDFVWSYGQEVDASLAAGY